MSDVQTLERRKKSRKPRSDWQLERKFDGQTYIYKDEIPTGQAKARAVRWRERGYLVRLLPGHTSGWTLTYYCISGRKKPNV